MLNRVTVRHRHSEVRPRDLWIETTTRYGRLAALLFEPQSAGSVDRTSAYFALVRANRALPVQRVP